MRLLTSITLCLLIQIATAQDTASKASDFYELRDYLSALPLYEDLVKQNPQEPLYHARLAVCLYAQSPKPLDKPQDKTQLERVVAESKMAVDLGTKEDYAQVIANFDLSSMNDEKGEKLAKAIWRSGEPYFGKKQAFKEALRRYATAAELEPKIYEPAMFAGDAAQFMGDLPTAAYWYERATRLEPNFAKAYVRWGDAIAKIKHDSDGAEAKYAEAIVANPYDPQGWRALQQWSQATGAVLAPPSIKPPNGGMELFKSLGTGPSDKSSWSIYTIDRFCYETSTKQCPIGTFKEDHPAEEKARRSLIGESKALHATALDAVETAKKRGKPDESLHDLIEIDKAGMIECWVLINGADQAIAGDYLEFSKGHRQLLHDYINRFIVHH
ncbi:MAG: hypothetical protein WBQ94_27710 [Terracidiphilus sp.]